MKKTYTVHGHLERRDGTKDAFWTRTGLSKSAANALAKEQRAETGGAARVVPDSVHAPRSKASDKIGRTTHGSYTVHGHIEHRDGMKEAFWTRTGLSKSAANTLAKEQRAETGGVARVVSDSAHATRRYSNKASDKIGRTMHEFKHGQLRSGSGGKVTSRKQALAIGLSQARREGYKVPPAHARRKAYPYIAYWVHTHRGGSRDSEAVYVLGTTTRADEGLVGHDLRVRPVRLGEGAYTMVVSPDDVKSKP